MNIAALMKQAQAMQSKMQDAQAKLAEMEFVGSAGSGAVSITLTGDGDARAVKIDPSVINAAEKDLLEDLIMAAINDARTKNREASAATMKDAMGGLNLPAGLKLPF